MMLKEPELRRPKIDFDTLVRIADRAQGTLHYLRDKLLEPHPRKTAPIVSASRLAQLSKTDRKRITYLCTRANNGNLPTGTLTPTGNRREFTLKDAQEFMRQAGPYPRRPNGAQGIVMCVGNFKGGVGKTTETVAFAQGLTLHGHKVCLIDLDPQASTTTLMGYVPDAEIEENMTVMPLIYGEQFDLSYAPMETYWPNLDLIASSPAVFGADYALPSMQANDPNFQFWTILDRALEPLRNVYDVILIDTPPTLSYLSIASFMAADGIVMPLPPETLDFASSTQFYRQFVELFSTLQDSKAIKKDFEFIKVVVSKVKSQTKIAGKQNTTDIIKTWIRETYPEILGNNEIPLTDIVTNASAEFKTIYDITRYDGSTRTYQRALEAFDSVVEELEGELQMIWSERTEKETA